MKSALTDACTLKLEKFEGPFDLLFYLIEKDQIDLYDIPISEITDQYLDYLNSMQELDLDIASEFLVMAATLLHIKSRMLLPGRETAPDDEIDPREALILRLVEYKRYKEFSLVLKDREEQWSHVHYKIPEAIPDIIEESELELSADILQNCFRNLLKQLSEKMDDVSQKMKRILNREKVSLRTKVKELMDILKKGIRIHFSKLYNKKKKSRLEVATGFLAMLEVVKVGLAEVEQAAAFDEIYIIPADNDNNETINILEED